MYIKLSQIPKNLQLEEVLQIVGDNEGIINDLALRPHVEYTKDDLLLVWKNLKNYQNE